MNRLAWSCVCLSMLVMVAICGCGDKIDQVEVSGSVTINGEPIEHGTISFVSVDGQSTTGGSVIKDGVYTAMVPPGEKAVLVLANKLTGEEPMYEGVADSPMNETYEMITPEAYNAKHLTPLKASITGPQEGLDFDLDSDFKG